jgi:hypothetical protein
MSTTNINVKILAEMLGVPSLNKGAKAVSSLEAGFKKLAGAIGIGLGTAEIVKFGKESVKAFAADQASAISLAKTLKNVGQAFADTQVEKFIKSTETSTGILDEKLRPAMETLVRATGDATKAQDLLTLSIDVAQGSGKDLATVSAALGKAYLGQTTALSKLGVGLTSAQLKGKSFVDIQKKLNSLFGGQAAAFADTYAGKIQKLGTAFDNVKEIVGKGLIDAFTTLAENRSLNSFTAQMESTATAVADIARGIADVGKAINNIPGLGVLGKLLGASYKNSILGFLQKRGASDRTTAAETERLQTSLTGGSGARTMVGTNKSLLDINAATLALIKANAEKAKQLKLDTAIAMLKKSMAVFDQQKIQVAAALQNAKLTADEKARLQLMQTQADLQQAIDDKNTTVLDGLMSKIQGLQDSLTKLQKTSIGNPFQEATDGLTKLYQMISQPPAGGVFGGGAQPMLPMSNFAVPPAGSIPGGGAQPMQVNFIVDGTTVATAITPTVQQGIVDQTASGVQNGYARNLGAPLRDSW